VSRCGRCNRPLKDAASRDLGFGPGCWQRLSSTERAAALGEHDATADDPAAPSLLPVAATVAAVGPPAVSAPVVTADRGSVSSPVAVGIAWIVVVLGALVVIEHWRWVLGIAAALTLLAVVGLAIEAVQQKWARRSRSDVVRAPSTSEGPR
jgi:hypothetical protein